MQRPRYVKAGHRAGLSLIMQRVRNGGRGTGAAKGATIFETRLNRAVTAAIHADGAAVVEKIAARGDVDETHRSQPVFGRQSAGDQRHAADKTAVEDTAEPGNTVRQQYPVDPVLNVGVIVADTQQAAGCGILRDAGGLQQYLLDRRIGALG